MLAGRMRGFVYQLVHRLAEPDSGLSRNRHFALLSSPAGARARRLHRHLRSLSDDIVRHGDGAAVSVTAAPAGWEVRVDLPALRLVRSAQLTKADLGVIAAVSSTFATALTDALRQAGALS
jgi:hypothetical protein